MSPLLILLSRKGNLHHFGIKIVKTVRCYCTIYMVEIFLKSPNVCQGRTLGYDRTFGYGRRWKLCLRSNTVMYLIDQFDGFNCQICSNLTSSFDLDVIMTTFKQIFDFDSGHDPYYLILQWIIIGLSSFEVCHHKNMGKVRN